MFLFHFLCKIVRNFSYPFILVPSTHSTPQRKLQLSVHVSPHLFCIFIDKYGCKDVECCCYVCVVSVNSTTFMLYCPFWSISFFKRYL